MCSMKRYVLMVVAATGLLGVAALAYRADATSSSAVRHVSGRTIFSTEFPKAELSVSKEFQFIGTQTVNLYGNAEAEQYLFVKAGSDKIVERFYLIQFEHFLPTNDHTYNYDSKLTTQIGDLHFVYNVGSFLDYAALLTEDTASDGAAVGRLLAKHDLSLPHRAVHVRMFHLPSADHRTELMIIYGEALPQSTTVPVGKDPINLDTKSPSSAQMFLEHAHKGITIQTR